jgi:hypothetical protein
MGTCQHCDFSPAERLLTWAYPDETYTMSAYLCATDAELVAIRHRRGDVRITEDEDLDYWADQYLDAPSHAGM